MDALVGAHNLTSWAILQTIGITVVEHKERHNMSLHMFNPRGLPMTIVRGQYNQLKLGCWWYLLCCLSLLFVSNKISYSILFIKYVSWQTTTSMHQAPAIITESDLSAMFHYLCLNPDLSNEQESLFPGSQEMDLLAGSSSRRIILAPMWKPFSDSFSDVDKSLLILQSATM